MPEQPGEAADDREPEAHPASAGVMARHAPELNEFVEHASAVRGGDADAGIDNVDADRIPRRRAPSTTPPVRV